MQYNRGRHLGVTAVCFGDVAGLQAVEQGELAAVYEVEDELSEEGVLPGEPGAGEVRRVVDVERFVDEACLGVGSEQKSEAVGYLCVVVAGEGTHHYAHRPCHAEADMRAADSLAGLSAEEVRIGFAPDETARVPIDGVVTVDVAEIGHGQKARHVGVVHEMVVAEPVDLECIDLAEFGMIVDGVALKGTIDFGCEAVAASGEAVGAVDGAQNLGRLAERAYSEEVRRNEVGEDRGVVRRTERRHNQSAAAPGGVVAVVDLCVGSAVGFAHEAVVAFAGLALLVGEGIEDFSDGGKPVGVEDRRVARLLPVLICQPQHVAGGVDLPFALVNFGAHLGVVAHPSGARRAVVESVGVGVEKNGLKLTAHDAGYHAPKRLVG